MYRYLRTIRRILKISSIIVMTAILISLIPVPASAAEPTENGPNAFAFTAGVTLYWMLTFVLKAVGWLSNLFQFSLRIPANSSVVEATWKIVRDFCNMFFILVMIVMTFATIFNIGGYKLEGKLVARLIIVAVLINFSLVISGLFIDGMNTVNQFFIGGLGDVGARFQAIFNEQLLLGGSGDQIARGTAAAQGIGGCSFGTIISCYQAAREIYSGGAFDNFTWNLSFQILFSLILAIIAMFSLLTPTFFAFIRVPFVWFLLIFSPLAALASILPATRSGWDKWLKEFIAWNIYLPVYLFALYFGLYFLAQQNEIIARLQTAFPASFWSQPLQGLGYSLQFIFFYIMAGIVLWAGTAFALSISRFTGTMAADYGAKWSQAAAIAVRNYTGDVTRIRPTYQGLRDAAGAQADRIRKEGLFGGKPAAERWRAGTAELFGATGAQERQKVEQIKYFEERYKKEGYDASRLRRIIAENPKDPVKQLAAYRRLKELKLAGADDLNNAYRLYSTGVGKSTALDFAKDIDFKKDFDRNERSAWFNDDKLANEVRARVAKTMAEEGELNVKYDIKNVNIEKNDIATAAEFFGTRKSRQEFLEKVAEKKPVEAYRLLMGTYKNPVTGLAEDFINPKTGKKFSENDLELLVGRKEPDDILKMLTNFYDASNDRFKDTLNPDQQALFNILSKLTEKRGRVQFLRKMYNNPKASPEQLGAIRAFADRFGIKPEELETREGGGSSGTKPSGGSGATTVRSNRIESANLIDLRKT